jgi:hypothetical protein
MDGSGYAAFVSLPRTGPGDWCRLTVFVDVRATSPAPFLGQRTELQNVVRFVASRCPAARTVRITGFIGDRRVYTGAVSDLLREATLRDMFVDRNLEGAAAAPKAHHGPVTEAPTPRRQERKSGSYQVPPPPAGPPPAAPGTSLAGEWEGRATCGREPTDVVLRIEAGAGGDDVVLLERFGPNALVAPVTYLNYLARFEADRKYRFAPATGQQFRIGQQRGAGFDGQLSQDRQELSLTLEQCGTFAVRRVTAHSPSRVSSVPVQRGGTYQASDSVDRRCAALIAWAGRINKEYPALDMQRTVLGEIYPKAVLLYADDDFVPVFGQPYDVTDGNLLNGIWEDIRRACRADPFIRDKGGWVWGHAIFKGLHFSPKTHYTGSFSTAAIVQTIRTIRRIRHEVKGAHGSAAGAYEPASKMLVELRGRLDAQATLLWPSELAAARDAISKRLNAVALKEAEVVLARIAGLRDPADGLKAVREGFEPNGFFGHLGANDNAGVSQRLEEHRRRFTVQVMQPVIDQALSAPVTVEGAKLAAGLAAQNASLFALLTSADQSVYRGQLDRRRDEILGRLADGDLETLRAMKPGLEGLKGGAEWIAQFDAKYREFASLAPLTAPRAAFVNDRAARILAAAPEFETQLSRIDRSLPEASSKARALLASFLCWPGDERLPEMLELAFIAARLGPM